MDTRFVQSLLAVVETGSIAAAARRESLTAAAIGQRIRTLEQELGCELLSRSAHSATPTEACLALLPRARSLLREARLMCADAQVDALSGSLSVGAISTVLTNLVPALLHETAARAPSLKITLRPGSSSFLYEQLLSGHLDAAMLVKPPFAIPKNIAEASLRLELQVFISWHKTPASKVAERLAAEPFIRYDPRSWGGQLAQDCLREFEHMPDVRFDLDALETISMLVSKGLGNSLVPHWPGLEQTGVFYTELPNSARYAREVVLLHRTPPVYPEAMKLLTEIASAIAKTGA